MKPLLLTIALLFSTPAWAKDKWYVTSSSDEMTGEETHYAISPRTKPNRAMDFPYQDVEGWIGIGCKKGEKWLYFKFSSQPNLIDTTEDGYNTLETRIKIDDEIKLVRFNQSWGSSSLFVNNSRYYDTIKQDELISLLPKANEILLELPWHGNGSVYFKYAMTGSANALYQFNNSCAAEK